MGLVQLGPVALAVNVTTAPSGCGGVLSAVRAALVHALLTNGPTVNDQVYGVPLTVRATVYLTPACSGCRGITITPPRYVRLLPTAGLLESMTQCASGTPLPVKLWTAPAVVATFPPTWMKTGSPVGTT